MSTLLVLTFSIFDVGSILDYVQIEVFLSIRDFVHSAFCPFGTLSFRDLSIWDFSSIRYFARFGFCPIRDFVHSGFRPIRDFVQEPFRANLQ